MKFKLWLQISENLAGPGGGPDLTPINLEKYYKDITNKGAGAFTFTGDKPPPTGKSPIKKYLPKNSVLLSYDKK